jgi:hypothetical protein
MLLWHDAGLQSDKLSIGFVLLGDNITWLKQWHVTEELYFPISGKGYWYHEKYR